MRLLLQNLFRAGLLLALLLFPGKLTAQETQGVQTPAAATEQPPAVPELADLTPLATALSDRLASLEKVTADQGELSRLEQQLGELSARVHEDVQQFLALKTSMGQRAGRLAELKAEIGNTGDTLTGVSKAATAKVRILGNLRKAWLAEQKQWNAWHAALLKDAPLEEITATVTKAQGVIATALDLLQQRLKPLLALQEQVGTLQTLLTENVLARRNIETGVSLAVARLVHYALLTIGFVAALVVLGIDLTKMTLLVSALGVGIGFGLQTIVNNFVCGLILLFERPLRVGDTIELGGQRAKIAKIGLRSTTVRTSAQADLIVPNTDLVTNQVANWTLTDRHAQGTIAVGVAYGSDVALVMQTLKECALAHPGVMKNPEPGILFRSFGDSALNFELDVRVRDIDNRAPIERDLHQEIERRFRQAGIEIPFPQRDLHVRSVENTNNASATVRVPLA